MVQLNLSRHDNILYWQRWRLRSAAPSTRSLELSAPAPARMVS